MGLVRLAVTRSSLIRRPALASKRIEAFLKEALRSKYFEDLPIPLHVTATNLEKGGQHIFSSGELIPALMASCAIPLVFPPVQVEGRYYVDGGISNNLPVEPFLAQKDQVVCVHVNPLPPFVPGRRGMLRTLDRVWHLNFREMVMRSAKGCLLLVEPPGLSKYNLLDVGKMGVMEEIGYAWAAGMLSAQPGPWS